RGVVTDFNLDKPLPDDNTPAVNNAIISSEGTSTKSWWQFWK
ncbi:TPA: outer membrane protein assembly factor BamE, partial [Pasteurella multocida]|nr:outer membrane protein assembly factor BamE [Pasteurella multocida]